jgi:hypothetical protein
METGKGCCSVLGRVGLWDNSASIIVTSHF